MLALFALPLVHCLAHIVVLLGAGNPVFASMQPCLPAPTSKCGLRLPRSAPPRLTLLPLEGGGDVGGARHFAPARLHDIRQGALQPEVCNSTSYWVNCTEHMMIRTNIHHLSTEALMILFSDALDLHIYM